MNILVIVYRKKYRWYSANKQMKIKEIWRVWSLNYKIMDLIAHFSIKYGTKYQNLSHLYSWILLIKMNKIMHIKLMNLIGYFNICLTYLKLIIGSFRKIYFRFWRILIRPRKLFSIFRLILWHITSRTIFSNLLSWGYKQILKYLSKSKKHRVLIKKEKSIKEITQHS